MERRLDIGTPAGTPGGAQPATAPAGQPPASGAANAVQPSGAGTPGAVAPGGASDDSGVPGQTPHQAERLRELLQAVGARPRPSLPMAQPTMFPRVELVQVMPALQRRRPQRRHQQDLRARGRQPARAVLRVELAVGVRGRGAMELSPRPSL